MTVRQRRFAGATGSLFLRSYSSLTNSVSVAADSSLIISGTAFSALGTLVSLSSATGTPVSLSLPDFRASLIIFDTLQRGLDNANKNAARLVQSHAAGQGDVTALLSQSILQGARAARGSAP